MSSDCALIIALASSSRSGSTASSRAGRDLGEGVLGEEERLLEDELEEFGCVKNELRLKAPGTGGVDQVMLAREPKNERADTWGSGSLTSSSVMNELSFALGAGADLALTNEAELTTEGDLWSDLKIEAGVVGPMLECVLRIVLCAGE